MSNQFEAFTDEQDDWIRERYFTMQLKDLTNEFNHHFNAKRSYEVMKQRCRKTLKLSHKFTNEMRQYLKDNYYNCSRKELTEKFNKHFGQNHSEQSIRVICNKMGLKFSENKERLSKIHSISKYPAGRIVKFSNGYWNIKEADGHYKLLSTHIWEEKYGKKPNGYSIIFLDRNKDNCTLDNLYCVSGRVNRELLKKGWYFSNPDLTMLAIKWAELFYALKDVGAKPKC